ncbi:MAG: helix-turn-helix transcriptional regulator [Deltaproteobacteria bacterium]|nr:helix-turn-helix transcriptional regulator [Deltaproteobacteria bacterium]
MKSFAETLLRLTEKRGLTMSALSAKTGIPRSTLNEWALGRNPKVSEDLIKLSTFLGVSLEFLLTGKDPGERLVEGIIAQEYLQIHAGTYRVIIERKNGGKESQSEKE